MECIFLADADVIDSFDLIDGWVGKRRWVTSSLGGHRLAI